MPPNPPSPHLAWNADGLPRSTLFDDVYFSRDGGLPEARAVFLEGCGLPAAWAGRERFTVGELGFGTGLNVAALLDLWRLQRPAGGRLHVFTVEAHPITSAEAARALGRWPELADVAGALTARWPGRARGFHRIDLPDLGAIVDVAVMDAAEALDAWSGPADAWFLDGFAPARNPAMWSEAVLAGVAAKSASGARAATYTVAGMVRRGLEAAGFAVVRRPGFGRKRERLEARLAGTPAAARPRPRVAIVGGGIAGASLARAFSALGGEAAVYDPAPGAGASGNPAALVTPRLDAGLGPPAALFAQAFARAVSLYSGHPEAIIDRGALQLETAARDAGRFRTVAASDLFEPGALQPLNASETTARLGEPAPAGLWFRDAQVVEPAAVLNAWLGRPHPVAVAALARAGAAWRLVGAGGEVLADADVVCLAAGLATRVLAPGLPLSAVRGQAAWAQGVRAPPPAAFGAYAIPTRDGVLFGATHDRGDEASDIRADDTARCLADLAKVLPQLAERIAAVPLKARAATRVATPDRLPIAGALGDGLFVLTGFGGRGFALAPLLAEHVAALATGAPSPLPADLAALVGPSRFTAPTSVSGRSSRRSTRSGGTGTV